VGKTTAQQPKVQQFELQDPQTAAVETSGSYYSSGRREVGGVAAASRGEGGKGREVRGERREKFSRQKYIY
jgi:hypothetical protein